MPNLDHFQISGDAAEFYDRLAVRYLLGPWSPALVDAAELRPDEQVLDLACGTGVVTREAASRLGPSGRIVGLDLNAGMLAVARRHGNPGTCPLEWLEASALDTGLPDANFDVVLSQQGFQFFPDQPKALREMHRLLKDGGRICFSVWAGSGPYNDAVAQALRDLIDNETAERYLQTRNVPSRDELAAMVDSAGFHGVSVTLREMRNRLPDIANFVPQHMQGAPIADKVRALSEADRVALGQTVAEILADYADGVDVVVPDFINLVQARK